MKSLRGLRWALESKRPRYVFHATPKPRLSFSLWRSFRRTDEDQATTAGVDSNSRSRPYGTKPPQHELSQPMRAAMRQLPHPVVVITTLENTRSLTKIEETLDEKIPRPIPRAMTVSSFTSLSIDPVPRVTFNITLPSTTYQALAKCGKFNAHILSGDEHGARVADLFTRGNRYPATKEPSEDKEGADLGVLSGLANLGVRVLGQGKWQKEWKLAKAYGGKVLTTIKAGGYIKDVAIPPSGTLPVLQGRGISYVLKCRYRHLSPPVDEAFDHHAIVIGEVVDVIPGKSRDDNGIALAYADRAYRQIGRTILERPTTEQVELVEESATVEGAPEESIPEESSPQETTPQENTPQEDTPQENTPQEITPQENTPKPDDVSTSSIDDQKQLI
ncbi:flavin reductase like domain-containing protein [Jackrogersella minutella]|nr:flavin reductase like domain-containing protein [Jackrogersella minutella]